MKKFKRKNAFTLIELLAVIIILAIIALIATPIILNVIEEAKISAGKSEANMILGGINNYCATEVVKEEMDENYTKKCTTEMNADTVKEMVNLGNATIDKIIYDGNKLIELEITSNNHKFRLCPSGTFAMDDEECQRNPNSLIEKLLKQYKEGETTGLVKDSTNPSLYYYTGTNEQVANNFLWYGGHQWRALEFDTCANTLTLITQQPLTAIQPASSVWETQEEYESSYINTWLNYYFWNSLDSSIQENILDNTFNVGIYTDVDEITTTQKVGLLDRSQYVRSGSQNSFLDIKEYYWSSNRYDSSKINYIASFLHYSSVSNAYGVRAVVKISDLTITEGDGTLTDSYRTSNRATNTNNVQVGEYINVPYSGDDNACESDNMCTFRVVSKDNDSIKVVLNGLLPNKSQYGSSSIITTSHTIYESLNEFVKGISDTYRYIGNKIFYIGDYPPSPTNYEDIKDETLEANIGLPTIGEMFSGNDIDMGSPADETKVFVDINTIENPTVSQTYWMMNRYSSHNILGINNIGTLITHLGENGVRPVLYLKSGLTFTEGEGTAQSPYVLS